MQQKILVHSAGINILHSFFVDETNPCFYKNVNGQRKLKNETRQRVREELRHDNEIRDDDDFSCQHL